LGLVARLSLLPRALRLTATLEAIQPSTPLSLLAVAAVALDLAPRLGRTTAVLVAVAMLAEQTLVQALLVRGMTEATEQILGHIITAVVVAVQGKLAGMLFLLSMRAMAGTGCNLALPEAPYTALAAAVEAHFIPARGQEEQAAKVAGARGAQTQPGLQEQQILVVAAVAVEAGPRLSLL
jgi:hypothetical protein